MSAIEHVTRTGELPADLGGAANTVQVTEAVCQAIARES
jgi:isocitrate/isopropylmalate dehydrogenase